MAARALGAFFLQVGAWKSLTSATFFAVGSMLFSWLLLRGRMIPIPLAGAGVVASSARMRPADVREENHSFSGATD